jgi:rhamnosyltransferase
MRILVAIVCYKPDLNQLSENIALFLSHVDKIVVWDNSGDVINNVEHSKITVLGDGSNHGIAYPLNQIVRRFCNSNYTHLMTMDQDSQWSNFVEYKNKIRSYNEEFIFCPNVNFEHDSHTECYEVDHCIISGTIFPLNVLRKLPKFNESYSVDCVDYDFCFNAKNCGIKILRFGGIHLNQIYGIPQKSSVLGLKSNEYPGIRLYFIIRNHVFLFRDYPKNRNTVFFLNSLKNYILFKIPKILLAEQNKLEKIFYIFYGLYHGFMNDRTKKY